MARFYKAQSISDSDIAAVVDVLNGDWLTTGPTVSDFECAFADFVQVREAVAVCNGTAALHAAMFAAGIQPGDEVLLPAMTFAATANAVVYQGGRPVFVDVDPETLLIDTALIEEKISPKTKAIVAVDYAGHPCDYDALQTIARRHHLTLIADACHAVGGAYKDRPVGSLADMNAFSFHPVKNMTTGEGGMVTTDNVELANRIRRFRNHGITADFRERAHEETWYYQMTDLGYNYRLTDIQSALGIQQLRCLPAWIVRKQEIAKRYRARFGPVPAVDPLVVSDQVNHAYHLFVVRLNLDGMQISRAALFKKLRSKGIPVNVHYIPVHLHPFYCKNFGTQPGLCPVAEAAYEQILSLPIHPNLHDDDIEFVIEAIIHMIEQPEACPSIL